MKPKNMPKSFKKQKAEAIRISGNNREQFEAYIQERCEAIKLQGLLGVGDPVRAFRNLEEEALLFNIRESIAGRQMIHKDTTKPEDIVKANPKPQFNGELVIENKSIKVSSAPAVEDVSILDWDVDTSMHEHDLAIIPNGKDPMKTVPVQVIEDLKKNGR